MKKIVTVVGARPQFIKAAPVSKIVRKYYQEVLVHTGQHYDDNMSDVFFRQLAIPMPDVNLEVGSSSHADQTANIMIKLEKILIDVEPSLLLIYGDTNSTLAASITAAKMHIPVAHIEAGLRNFDLAIPEEINRVIADKLSTYLFAPTKTAVDNLKDEGLQKNVFLTGDVMYDSLVYALKIAEGKTAILNDLNLQEKKYCLVTIHRAENTDNVSYLEQIIKALGCFPERVIFPIHPRTQKVITVNGIVIPNNVSIIPSIGYLDFIVLESNARMILTDSGGVQREAYCLQIPCITVFPSTSWVETVEDGWNKLADASVDSIMNAYSHPFNLNNYRAYFGDGHAAEKTINILRDFV